MNSNRLTIVDREMAAPQIEGLDFGTKLWVIARSPDAVLVWVYGHSASINGHQRYYEPHLTLLPDRTSSFMNTPVWESFDIPGNRLKASAIKANDAVKIGGALGIDIGEGGYLTKAILEKKTLIIEGGGGKLMPYPKLWGHAYADWIKNPDNGFIPRAEINKGLRHKLGYKGEMA